MFNVRHKSIGPDLLIPNWSLSCCCRCQSDVNVMSKCNSPIFSTCVYRLLCYYVICMLNIELLHFPSLLDPCFLAFYTTIALYITNFLIENDFSYLFHSFLFIQREIQYHGSCAKVLFPNLK